ncbi:MAG TPA: hypothetical protein VFZ09_20965 [Archangium sp.]|uniref:hypothetical protein n=1 Tax=Archangium sp. TaxID=1872627 RepID=UPI002E30BD34|nr:hypothetical protein [Archangium sp.]HEX5748725.1 hypothetical protein [Archangium sp.]
MKVLDLHGLPEEDSLRLEFKGGFEPQEGLQNELESFLLTLEEHADGWMPDVVNGKRQRKYSHSSFWKALEERRSQRSTGLGLYRTTWPALDMSLWLSFASQPPKLDCAVIVKPLSFFTEAARCQRLVDMVRAWASRYPVCHASAHSSDDSELAGFPSFGRELQTTVRDGFDKIYEVFWLNIFGPKLVETVGRERMLSTPAHRVEELPNGSVLLVTWPTVTDFASKEARLAQARAHAHLRPHLDFDTVLHSLHERSARLAPVEPRFHPDLAPLLSRVVDRATSHERPRRIAELNAWQPPEPEEWRPANSALPPDVDDPERALEYYGDLAEHLVALLHSEVPSVFNATPESLTDADFYFWREEFPTSRLREAIDEHAVPAIGAYLGEVLVRNLGGRWIPRKKLEEAQVLVGNRVWLPFVRARNAMRSRQSLLDCSLTWLYRVAERHRG